MELTKDNLCCVMQFLTIGFVEQVLIFVLLLDLWYCLLSYHVKILPKTICFHLFIKAINYKIIIEIR